VTPADRDAAAAVAVLADLPHEQAARLAAVLPAGIRKRARDLAVRRAFSRFYGDLLPTPAADDLAADLTSHAAEGAPGGSARRDALSEILALNRGTPLSARHLISIWNGIREH
jgi:hypothetical protein